MAKNLLLAAIDDADYREGEESFAHLVLEGKLFPLLDEIAKSGTTTEIRRVGVQVHLLVIFHVTEARDREMQILKFAQTAAGFRNRKTLEDAWGAKPTFELVRVRQRLRELQMKAGSNTNH